MIFKKMGRLKDYFLLPLLTLIIIRSQAQRAEVKLYDPMANAGKDIAVAVQKAKAGHKHVLLQAGGNWCSWCVEFNRFAHADSSIDSLLNKCFIVYHLNYSKENQNKDVFAKFGYPQRFGFPVFIILDENGNRIHTQNSEYLEQGKSYNKQEVINFLLQWSPQALDPSLYK
jgi:thioredoxin-related protein